MNDSFRQAGLATSLRREAGVWVGDFRLFFVSLLRGMSTAVDRGRTRIFNEKEWLC